MSEIYVVLFLAMLFGLQDLSSLTRGATWGPCSGSAESARKFPEDLYLKMFIHSFFFLDNLKIAIVKDDTTLMAESEEELKSLWMKVKEESEKFGLKLYIQKTKIMGSNPITSWQIDGETVETVADYFFGLQNHCRW